MSRKVTNRHRLMLACGLSIVLLTVTAQPLRWRDVYIDWRGELHKLEWQLFRADDGGIFLVDTKSVKTLDSGTSTVVAYIGDVDDFDPTKLVQYMWDCRANFFEAVSNVDLERMRSISKQAKELACSHAP